MQQMCHHCLLMNRPHKFVCDCSHTHNDHVFGAGCKKCPCERYSQVKQRKPNDKSKGSDNTVSISEDRV